MASAMHLNVRSHGFSLTPAIRDYTERRLRFALSHAAGRVTSITVVLSDINGPRGGRDKCCRVRINVSANGDYDASKLVVFTAVRR